MTIATITPASMEYWDAAVAFLRETIYTNPYIPVTPHDKQAVFLSLPVLEALYGGAAGGGKTAALLMGALQFVSEPGYNALLLRRTYADLMKPESLIPLSHEWLSKTNAEWHGGDRRWVFPSGATLNFGYCDTELDKYNYQSAAYQYIGFDELTQFTESQFTYLFSRLRRRKKQDGSEVLLRMRAGANPGGVGHEWVRDRFVLPKVAAPDRMFIPAKLEDNPSLDQEEYLRALDQLDIVTRTQLRHGDWLIRPEGNLFKRAWFPIIVSPPYDIIRWYRHWDLAATPASEENKDPDYAAGCKIGACLDGSYCIADVKRIRGTPQDVEELVRSTAHEDGIETSISLEEEPGSAGKIVSDHYIRNVLRGFEVHAVKPSGDKVLRAGPMSSAAERHLIKLLSGSWLLAFLDELCAFPAVGMHDDQVDAATGGFLQASGNAGHGALIQPDGMERRF